MKNKLGLCDYKLMYVERDMINFKLNMLDETYTFNCDLFSLDYIINLNKFLFQDIYDDRFCGFIAINEIERDYLQSVLKELEISSKNGDVDSVLSLIKLIWHYQPLIMGNTRTLIAYLKVINESFLLNIPLNVNSNIESNPKMFELKHMLTKNG